MAGSNVIAAYYGGTGRNQILSQTLAATTETEFKIGNDAASTSVIAVLTMPQQSTIQGSTTPLDQTVNPVNLNSGFNQAGYFGDANPPFNTDVFNNGKPFLIRLAGLITPASNAANTLTIKFYVGTSKSGTNICSSGAVTGWESSTQAGAFVMESQVVWDSTSTLLNGQMWWMFNSAVPDYHTWAVNTAVSAATTLANLKFCASAAWGNAAGGVIAISEFSISRL